MSADRVLAALRSALRQQNLLTPQARLLCAVSGGSDSMALLSALHHLQSEAGFALFACHVQHGLRGQASQLDEQLVQDTCQRWAIPLTVYTAQLGGDLHQPGMETKARDCRRRFYADALQATASQALLLAHHQDDQAETLLLHLLRGSGANGLSGMRPAAPFAGSLLLRPFLSLPKQALIAALTDWGVPYREDASNQEALTPRNALRLHVLPLLESLSPGCTSRMAQTAHLLARDEAALSRQAQALLDQSLLALPGLHALPVSALLAADEAVAVRCLRLWVAAGWQRCGLCPDEQGLSAEDSQNLLACLAAPNPQPLNLPQGLQALRSAHWLHLQRQDGQPLVPSPAQPPLLLTSLMNDPQPIPLPGWTEPGGPTGPALFIAHPEQPAAAPTTARDALLPLSLLPGCVLRTPAPDDVLHPLGAPGSKPLRRYLTDRKIDLPFRPLLPVLAQGDTILWIPGLCTAQALAHQPGQPCLRLSISGPLPYLTMHKGD